MWLNNINPESLAQFGEFGILPVVESGFLD
jgi:hypothetical protein